jgi:hypothetical protein
MRHEEKKREVVYTAGTYVQQAGDTGEWQRGIAVMVQ